MSRKGWNLARLETERSDDLQHAEVGRRFDGNGIARFGDGAQGKVKRFLATTGDDDVVGREGAPRFHGPSRDLDPQLVRAWSHVVAIGQLR